MKERRDPLKRVLVTASAMFAVWALSQARFPWIHLSYSWLDNTRQLSPVALGLNPLIAAYLTVEVFAFLVPKWRPLRRKAAGRAEMWRVIRVLAVVLALVQSVGIALWLESLAGMFGPVVTPGWGMRALNTVCFAAGVAPIVVLVRIIERWGIGHGFSVILVSFFVLEGWDALPAHHVVIPFHQAGAVAAVVIWAVLCWQITTRAPRAILGAGLVPWNQSWSLLEGLVALDLFRVPFTPPIWSYLLLAAVLTVILNPRAKLRDAGLDPMWFSRTFVLGVAVFVPLQRIVDSAPFSVLGVMGTAATVAVLVDIAIELHARHRANATLHHVATLHYPYALVALRQRLPETPFHASGAAHRSLLHAFGPFIPIRILATEDERDAILEALGDLGYPAAGEAVQTF